MKEVVFKSSIKINHPLATSISVQDSQYHYCTPGVSSEIAFFKNGEFVTQLISPFEKYSQGNEADTMIYSFVPNNLIEEFLQDYGINS
jgi:hypothetical protein